MNRKCRFLCIVSFLGVAMAQPAAFVVGEKGTGYIGLYDASGKRLDGVKVGNHPHEMVLLPDNRTLYVADNGVVWMTEDSPGENTVSIVDVVARKRLGTIDLGEFRRPHGITFDANSGHLFVTTERPSWLLAVDPVARKVLRKYDVQGKAPHMVLLGEGSNWAYVSNTDTGTLAAVRLPSGEVKLMKAGERPQGQAFSPDRKTLYVANSGGSSISVFDVEHNEPRGSIPTGKGPVRVVVTPDNKTLIYALSDGHAVGFADIATRKETKQIPVDGITVSMSLSRDGRLAYCSAQEVDKVYVISVADRKIERVWQTPKGTKPDPVIPLR